MLNIIWTIFYGPSDLIIDLRMIFNVGEPVIILSDLILKQLLNIANIKVKNTNGRPLFDGHLCNCNFFSETNPGGIIGITINTDHYAPATNSAADVNAADLQFEMQMGYWAEPIYGSGDYPDQVKKVLKVRFDADAEKRPLPEFSEAQVKLNQDYRSDFFGLNHYTTSLISRKPNCDAPDDSQCLEFR